jgi:hypothetical protein
MEVMEGTEIDGYTLARTCYACPEQYDVFKDGELVGYLRLRHGYFYAAVPDAGGEVIYETAEPMGDGLFEPEERDRFLAEAVQAIKQHG